MKGSDGSECLRPSTAYEDDCVEADHETKFEGRTARVGNCEVLRGKNVGEGELRKSRFPAHLDRPGTKATAHFPHA